MIIKLQLCQHQLFYFRYPSGKHHKSRSTRLVFHVNYQFSSFKNNQHSERRSIRLVSKSPLATKMQNRYIKSTVGRPAIKSSITRSNNKLCKYHAKATKWRQNLELHRSISINRLTFFHCFHSASAACELLSNPIYLNTLRLNGPMSSKDHESH